MFALKALSHESVPGALARVERYRLLNEPAQAESICSDILAIQPENQEALIGFVLSLSDQIPQDKRAFQNALAAAGKLNSEYDRAYYTGLVWERRARALHHEGARGSQHSVYEWILKALHCFEEAERKRPPGNDDAVLRWNTCVRFLAQHPGLTARAEEIPEAIISE
jgi:hypothetical protein